jgi:hypothetical protein
VTAPDEARWCAASHELRNELPPSRDGGQVEVGSDLWRQHEEREVKVQTAAGARIADQALWPTQARVGALGPAQQRRTCRGGR